MEKAQVEGLVLAGGKSSRMGRNKMWLHYQGKPFIEHTIDALKPLLPVTVSLKDGDQYDRKDIAFVYDEKTDIGPLGGLYSFFRQGQGACAFLWACDMPYLSTDFVDYVLSQLEGDYEAYVIRDREGRISPMGSIYTPKLIPIIEGMINQKCYRMMTLIEKAKVKYIDLKYTIFEEKKILANINTPLEYQSMQGPIVFAVSGVKNSGKTTVVCELVKEFTRRGFKVGTIKHDGHEFEADCKGTDSYKHKASGAKMTAVYDKTKFCIVKEESDLRPERLLDYYREMDMVILEGFKASDYPKIEVIRKNISSESVCDLNTVIAFVTDLEPNSPITNHKSCYDFAEILGLSQYILDFFRS